MAQQGWTDGAYESSWVSFGYNEQAAIPHETAYTEPSFHSASTDMPSGGGCVNPADLTQDSAYGTQPSDRLAATNDQYMSYQSMNHPQAPNLDITSEQASFLTPSQNVQVPLSQNTTLAPAAPEKTWRRPPKRCRNNANFTEDKSDRPRAGKRPKAPQENFAPTDRDLIRYWLAYHRSQSPNTRASEVTMEHLQNLASLMQKGIGHVAEIVKSEICFDGEIKHEAPAVAPPSLQSGQVLAQKYADEAIQHKCDQTRGCEGRYQCIFKDCCYQTDKVDALKRHLDVRRPSTVYVCEECLKQSAGDPFMHQRKDKFRRHLRDRHDMTKNVLTERSSTFHPDAKRTFCGFCSEEFETLLVWRDHVISHFKYGDLDHGGRLWNVRQDWRIPQANESEDENQSGSDSEQFQSDDGSDEYHEHDDDDNDGHTGHDGSGNSHNDATGPSGGSSGGYQSGKGTTGQGQSSTHYSGPQAGTFCALSTGGSGIENLPDSGTTLLRPLIFYQKYITYIDHLGRGANGSVDKVKNIFTGETYARKSVKIKKRGAAVEASFEREIQILRTRTHPSIPRFIDVYRDGATLNVLMEPAAELNLKQYLENPWKVQSCTQDILNWLRDITAGVAALHAPDSNNMSIRHGDIKPSNILVALRRTEANMATKLILIDFGASRAVPANDSESSSNCAKTPMYAAPEINEKERHGRKADIFSLACVFVELLTVGLTGSVGKFMSRLQFSSKESRPYSEKLEELADWLDELKKEADPSILRIIDICRKMLRRSADQRPTAEMISEILSCIPYPDPCKQADSYSWLEGSRDSKAEDIAEQDSNLLEATQNPGGRSPQVDLTSSSDDEFVLPERSAQEIDDETVRQKVVHQSSDYGQDPRVRALRPTSNLERMQSPQRIEAMTNSIKDMSEKLKDTEQVTEDTLIAAQDLAVRIEYQVSQMNENSERSTPEPERWRVLYAFEPKQDEINVLRLKAGDIVRIIRRSPSGWWEGVLNDGPARGWFPSTYCTPLDPPLDLVLFDDTPDDALVPLSEEERAAEGWEQLETYPIAQALSLESDIEYSGTFKYLLCPSADTPSRINAALMLFMNTRSTVEQLMSLPHLYRHDIGEICVELRALEDTLAELVTVFEREDGLSNYIEPLRPCILTETGICLRSIVSLRKIVFENEEDIEGEIRFKIEQPSDRKVIASCKKEIRTSTQALDGTLSNYRSRALGLVFRNRSNRANAETGNSESGSFREYQPRPLLLQDAPLQSPEPISTDEPFGPLDLGPSRKQLRLETSRSGPLPSIDRFSQSSRVSTTSSILSSGGFSSLSRASFASSATSVSTSSSSPRKPGMLRGVASPKNTISDSLPSGDTRSWDNKLRHYCAILRVLPPRYFKRQNGEEIAWSVKVKDGMVHETSQWYASSEEAREEAAKLALEKLTWTMPISPKREKLVKPLLSYEKNSVGEGTISQHFAGKCSHTGFWG